MSTCGTCRWWSGKDPASLARCNRVWDVSQFDDGRGGLPEDEIACTEDGEGWASRLLTRGTFGCVLHEPADDA